MAAENNSFLNEILNRLENSGSKGSGNDSSSFGGNGCKCKSSTKSSENKSLLSNITPSKAVVIAGILGGALDVYSVLVDKNQQVQIVLSGSFAAEDQDDSNDLEGILDQLGSKSFDEVVKAMISRLT